MSASKPWQIRKGQRFGKRKVLQTGLRDGGGKPAALCECECGDVSLVQRSTLLSGRAQSCLRCRTRPSSARLRPQAGWHQPAPGRLKVLTGKIVPSPGGNRAVHVRCDCGAKKLVEVSALFGGHTKSCGCLQRETARKLGQNLPLPS